MTGTLPFPARTTDPASSHEAARTVRSGSQVDLILRYLTTHGRVTADLMMERHPNIHRSTWSSRLAQLVDRGDLEVVGTTVNGIGRTVQVYAEVAR